MKVLRWLGGSFRREVILGLAAGIFLLVGAFSAYLVWMERAERYQDSRENTESLVQALAASSRMSLLAEDVAALQEIVQSFRDYPGLRYAMVISPAGKVLGHTDASKVGSFLADEQSAGLIGGPGTKRVLRDDVDALDIALPIEAGGRLVGWARIEVGREDIVTELRHLGLRVAVFVLVSTTLALLASVLIANRLGYRISALAAVAEQVQAGNFYIRAEAHGRLDEIGKLATSFNQMLDELARNERELRAASLYTRSLIEASLDPLVTISPEGKITDVNAATEKVTGKGRDELIGTDFSDYFTEPDKARAGYRKVFLEGSVVDYPLAIRHRDGHVTDVLYNASVYRSGAGGVLGVFAAARDVTARKRAEEQLRESEASLAEAQRMAHLGNWNLDLVNDVLTWSAEIYRIFEIDPEKFGATYEAFLAAIHPDDRDMVNAAYAESLKTRAPYDIVHRLLMKDGRVKYVNERCVTYFSEDGRPLRSIGTVHDITERKLAEDEIRALNRDLEQRVAARTAELAEANKELEGFAYSVSHDLRVPLRAIDGFSRILLEEYRDKLDAEGQRLLSIVRDNTRKMAQLIDDILAFSRTGRLAMSLSEVDMAELARRVFDDLKPTFAEREVVLELRPLPPAHADRAMMERVFANLFTNAVKFTRSRPKAMIEVGSIASDKEDTYYVRDNGVGFDMQYVDKLFGVFQRLHGTEEFEGTGIGLAIVKRVISRHGGRVWAEGRLNEGATFYFTLPKREIAHD
jgi:PAS domain S-box-containing protein